MKLRILAVALLLTSALSAAALATHCNEGDPCSPAVTLTFRESDIESNAATPSGSDPKQVEFFGAGGFDQTLNSTASSSTADGSASATGSSSEDSSVAVNSGGLSINASVTLSATSQASGEQAPGFPMFAGGLGDEELDVTFDVEGAPHRYSISGSRTVPLNGAVEIRLSGPGGVVFSRVNEGSGSFTQSGTLQPGGYSLSIDAVAEATNNSGASNGGYNLALDVEPDLAPAPAVEITSAPPATTTATSATFGFRTVGGSPPPGGFQCSVDGSAFASCSSPFTSDGFAVGDHRFSVRYKPNAGDAGDPAETTWRVVPACPDVRVGNAVAQGCFTERVANGTPTGVFETEGEAWIGGFQLRPRPGSKLVVQNRPEAPLAAEGAIDWVLGDQTVPAPLGEIHPFASDFSLSLNTAGTVERFVDLPLFQGVSAQLKVTWDGDGKGSKVEASVSIEELTKNLGTPLAGSLGLGGRSIGTLAGKLSFTLANGRGAEVADGELELPEFAVEVKGTDPALKEGFGGGKLKARRVDGSVEWSGEVTTLFPWRGNQGSLTGRLFLRDLALAGAGFGLSGFRYPIGKTGWDMTGLEGDVIYNPAFALNIGAKAERRGIPGSNAALLKITGNLKALALAASDCGNGSNPYAFVGTFNAPELENLSIGEFKGTLTMCAYLQGARNFAFEAGIGGELTLDLDQFKKIVSAQGSAKGWFQGVNFNLDGSYRLKLPLIDPIGADAVFSSEGYAVCGRYGFINAGIATNNWLEAPEDISACDFTPFRAVASGAGAGSEPRSVTVPPGQSAFSFALRGRDAAPRVSLTSPGGERFTTPAGDADLKTRDAIILPVDQLRTTYVFLRDPRPGSWRIEGDAVERIETASQLPEPRVRARVVKKGAKVLVRWSARRIPGQKIELVDRADGVATTIQKPTSRARGRVSFAPANPLETRRRIEAVITRNGAPRPSIVAARYRLKAPRRPGKVRKPRARRASGDLLLSWRKAARAKDYLVTISAGTEMLTRTLTARRTLTYTEPPRGKVTIRIVPRDRFGRSGPAVKLTG